MNRLDHPHIAGLVLARGGSRGIPLKNVALLNNKSLLSWSLDAMQSFQPGFDSVWVSTDHPLIAECAAKHQGVQVFWRSPQFATHDAPSISATQEFLEHHPEIDVVALIQCTSPFIQPKFLERAHKLIMKEEYDAVFSVTRVKKFRWKEVDQGSSTQALNFDPSQRPRRQDWKGDLVENGMFYFARRHLIEKGLFQGGKCTYLEVPNSLSLEIDSHLDLACAQSILDHHKSAGKLL